MESLFSFFVLYLFQYTYLSNLLLETFDISWLSFTDNVTTRTCNFLSLIIEIILLELALSLPAQIADKTQ